MYLRIKSFLIKPHRWLGGSRCTREHGIRHLRRNRSRNLKPRYWLDISRATNLDILEVRVAWLVERQLPQESSTAEETFQRYTGEEKKDCHLHSSSAHLDREE